MDRKRLHRLSLAVLGIALGAVSLSHAVKCGSNSDCPAGYNCVGSKGGRGGDCLDKWNCPPLAARPGMNVEGTITFLQKNPNRLRFQGNGILADYKVPSSAQILIDGKAAAFGDLRVGDKGRVTYTEGGLARTLVEIRVGRKPLKLTGPVRP